MNAACIRVPCTGGKSSSLQSVPGSALPGCQASSACKMTFHGRTRRSVAARERSTPWLIVFEPAERPARVLSGDFMLALSCTSAVRGRRLALSWSGPGGARAGNTHGSRALRSGPSNGVAAAMRWRSRASSVAWSGRPQGRTHPVAPWSARPGPPQQDCGCSLRMVWCRSETCPSTLWGATQPDVPSRLLCVGQVRPALPSLCTPSLPRRSADVVDRPM